MPTESIDAPASTALPRRRRGFGWTRVILIVCLLACIAYVASAALQTVKARQASQANEDAVVATMGLITPTPKPLASKFTDSKGTLLADAPSAANQLLDPDTLVIAHLDGADETPGASWDEFAKHLSAATGKTVKLTTYSGSTSQIAKFADGTISLAAVHPADAPFLVDNYGFHPVAVLGTDLGANGNHLDIIVPAGSSIASPADIKGHSLACSAPSSITGYRAAIVALMQGNQLRPNVDYTVLWSMGQKESIKGIAGKKYDAAAVSDDKLQSMLENDKVNESDFKIIYKSDVIPRTTIGYFYNLNPVLAGKVQQAILSFAPAGKDQLKFLPIDYKKDFAFVRTIDDSFDPRLDSRMSKSAKSD